LVELLSLQFIFYHCYLSSVVIVTHLQILMFLSPVIVIALFIYCIVINLHFFNVIAVYILTAPLS